MQRFCMGKMTGMSANVAIVYNIRSLQLSSGLFAFGDGVRGVEVGSGFWSAKLYLLFLHAASR